MKIKPVHPGEIILEDYLEPLGLSQSELARGLKIPVQRVNDIIRGKRRITADTALRLSRYTGTSAKFWMDLQAGYDLMVAEDTLSQAIEKEVSPRV